MVEQFLTDLLGGDDTNYPDNVITVSINKSLEEIHEGQEVHYDHTARVLRDTTVLADQGLALLLDIQKELVLSQDTLDSVFKVIAKIATQKPQNH